jgi:hypothetical protein
MTDFMAVLPADEPRYLLLIMLDEPKAIAETHGFATAGWNAGPVAAKVIARVAPLLGLEPRYDLPPADQLILASLKGQRVANTPPKEPRRADPSPKEARTADAAPKDARHADPQAKEARNADASSASLGRSGQSGTPRQGPGTSVTASTADR